MTMSTPRGDLVANVDAERPRKICSCSRILLNGNQQHDPNGQ